MNKQPGRMPDFQLHALNKATEARSQVGAAWQEDDGRISIKLNQFVTLEASPDLVLSLFPVSDQDRQRWAKERERNKQAGHDKAGNAKPF